MSDTVTKRFAARCKALRAERKLSQLQMAIANGFSPSHYAKLEMGHIEPKLHTIAKVARSFGVPISELLSGV